MPSKLKPIGSHVIVKRATPDEKSKGGIIIPEKGKEKPKQGSIVAVGNGKMMEDGKRQAMQLKAGDQVLFNSYGGTEVKVEGDELLVMEESEILAVIK
jgi:chaperonin GroES